MSDIRYPYCIIPTYRVFDCQHYSRCLDLHLDSTGWTCLECPHQGDREPILPDEGLRCLLLLAEIYHVHPAKLIREMVAEERDQAQRHADFWRQAETEAAA